MIDMTEAEQKIHLPHIADSVAAYSQLLHVDAYNSTAFFLSTYVCMHVQLHTILSCIRVPCMYTCLLMSCQSLQ